MDECGHTRKYKRICEICDQTKRKQISVQHVNLGQCSTETPVGQFVCDIHMYVYIYILELHQNDHIYDWICALHTYVRFLMKPHMICDGTYMFDTDCPSNVSTGNDYIVSINKQHE